METYNTVVRDRIYEITEYAGQIDNALGSANSMLSIVMDCLAEDGQLEGCITFHALEGIAIFLQNIEKDTTALRSITERYLKQAAQIAAAK